MNRPEFYMLLGIIILITRFDFRSRVSIWSCVPISKYIPAPKLGMTTGISRPRFDELWSVLRWSNQPIEQSKGIPHVEHWWMLIGDMVEIFNQHKDDFLLSE